MFGRRRNKSARQQPRTAKLPLMETLESRRFLSASTVTLHNDLQILKSDTSSSTISGYTPAQIKKAYGIDEVSFSNGTVTGDGSGETIAIVDAYNDPTLSNDLGVFDTEFGIASANLKVENEHGGSTLPSTDGGWAGEISLDVEWAHAIAPGAKIVLVEASSASLADLLTAVDTARNTAGVSVVSMSWGGSEFFSYNASESSDELADDYHFTTPSGHEGITFVASAGDSGSFSGVQWPAASPNVLSVGGTSLYTSDSSGTYSSESSWSGTSGGYSQYEATPSYQASVNTSGARSVPDVSYDGDPNTGFAVYDSTPDTSDGTTYVGWQEVGGTSAGAPQWAAIIAIANQGRAIAGKSTLDGASQTLVVLYSVYNTSSYDADFNDVVDSGGGYQFPWGGFGNVGQATVGYDTATGLGSPKAAQIVDTLVGSGSSGSSGSGGTTTTTLPDSPLTATVISAPTGTVIGSESGNLTLRLTNDGSSRYIGAVTVSLYATTSGTITSSDSAFATISIAKVNIAQGASKKIVVHFKYPTGLANGSYVIAASVAATATDTSPSQTAAPAAVTIDTPTVDLSTAFDRDTAVLAKPGHRRSIAVTITNKGNVTADGQLTLNLYASADGTLDAGDELLATLLETLNLKAGQSVTFHIRFRFPDALTGGNYDLIASASSTVQPTDTNTGDKAAVLATRSS
jgi:subtilase family serine protease